MGQTNTVWREDSPGESTVKGYVGGREGLLHLHRYLKRDKGALRNRMRKGEQKVHKHNEMF